MPLIRLELLINAPIERCFDLARNLDLHKISTSQTKEYIIAGKDSGLISLGEEVTWRAKHFGVWQNLTSKITEFDHPNYFCDEMVKGIFKSFKHKHKFVSQGEATKMIDVFEFESPFGILGNLFNKWILTDYMTNFLVQRNKVLKDYAETEKWKDLY